MVRIGLLGAGFLADLFMRSLVGIPDSEVKIVFSNAKSGPKSAKAFASKWEIEDHTSELDKVFEDKRIDTVIIALPNHLHKEAAIKAAGAKKNVICTKPLGRDAEEAFKMLEAVKKADIFHGYAETEVFNPATVKARTLIENGGIGKILTIRSREGHIGPHEKWFLDPVLTGGGVISDLGSHCIEAFRYLVGKDTRPLRVFSWAKTTLHDISSEDNAVVLLEFEGNVLATAEVSWTTVGGVDFRNEIFGSEGLILTDVTRDTSIKVFSRTGIDYVTEKSDSDRGWIFPALDEARMYGYFGAMKHFVECFNSGIEPRETFADGYEVNRIMDSAYRSVKSGKWESLDNQVNT